MILQGTPKFCPWGSRFQRDNQIFGTGLRSQSRYCPKCVVSLRETILFTSSNFSCTNWQLRLHPSRQFPVHCCSAFLLVLRVVALYKNNKCVFSFFGLCWLAVLAISIIVPMGAKGMQIQNTPYCVETKFKPYAITGAITPFVHDTLIFLAMTWVFCEELVHRNQFEKFF